MVKRIRTLLTLFLLLMGTTMSWAAFKDFSLDFTKAWAAEQISTGGSPSSLYVTATEDGVPTLSATAPDLYVAHILGYYKNSTYGLYYNAKVKVPVKAGKYKIDLGMSDYGGNIAISDGTNVLTIIDSKGAKYAADKSNVATGEVTVKSDCVLEIYASENATNVYFPYIAVSKVKEFEFKDFALDFTKTWAAENINPSGAASSWYVTDATDGVPALSAAETTDYMAHILGYYKNSTYGLWYNAKVKVRVKAGKYQITLGMSDYGGNIAISDGTNVLATIDSKGAKYAADKSNVATGEVTVASDCVLEIYASENATNVYFPYIAVSKVKEFEFKDFALDFTKTWASENINASGAASSWYVTDATDGVPALSAAETTDYMAHILGYYKNSTYGLWYNAKVKVRVKAGKYQIALGMSDYGGKIAISDGTNVLTTIDSKGAKYAADKNNVATGEVTVKSDGVLEIYASENATNVYFPYIGIKRTGDVGESEGSFKDFKIDFRSNPYTLVSPKEGLPECVTLDAGGYHSTQHGTQFAKVTVKVDGPVKFSIGSCGYTNTPATVSIDGGNPIAIDNKTPGCDNSGVGNSTKFAEYRYNVEKAATLTFELGEYCPFFYAEACEYVPEVKVAYYNTNGSLIGEEVIAGSSALKYKYNASNVTVPAGEAFRGWFASTSATAKKVLEGTAVNADLKLYAKTTPIEVATTSSTHSYDLSKDYWYCEDHELIEIAGGKWHDGQHGWDVASGSTVKLKLAGDALVTVTTCQYSKSGEVVVTDAANREVARFNGLNTPDATPCSFMYKGGATTLTMTYSNVAYIHSISVEHIVPVAFEPFKVDFREDPYLVATPESGSLPACVNIDGGTWHDNQHGYSNVTMTVKVDRPVKFKIGSCNYTDKATVSVDGGAAIDLTTKSESCDGGTGSYNEFVTYTYKGTGSAVIKFTLGKYCPYIVAEEFSGLEYDEATKTYNVAAGNVNQLLDAISEANVTGNVSIYLPNGVYNLGEKVNTQIKANNISIIGESRDGVVIKNTPTEEGIGTTAVLYNTSEGLYLQDITLNCYAPWKGGNERGVAFWDHGNKTICKNVYLKGTQDTYWSNGSEGMVAYFEGGKIEGTVDFICGSGNILFNAVNLICTNSENKTSGDVIAAPSTYASEKGYVFLNCKISGTSSQDGSYYFARGWQKSAAAVFVNPILEITPAGRFKANISELDVRRFAIYGAGSWDHKDADALTSTVNMSKVIGSWNPIKIISAHNPIKTNAAGWASYTAYANVHLDNNAKAYAAIEIHDDYVLLETLNNNDIPAYTGVFVKGAENANYNVSLAMSATKPTVNKIKSVVFDSVLQASDNAYVLGTKNGTSGLYKVNSNIAISAGKAYLDATGVSTSLAKDVLDMIIVDEEATAISEFNAGVGAKKVRYNLAGQKVGKNYKGVVVENGKARLVK